jgi:glycosyltransferase involved in cell wall biosynthesis
VSRELIDSYLLSIVIPVTNLADDLDQLRSSLSSALEFNEVQVVLVHDKRDEKTTEQLGQIVQQYIHSNLVFLEGVFGNPGAARNAGMKISKGEWIAFWDAGDLGEAVSLLHDLKMNSDSKLVIIGQFEKFEILKSKVIMLSETKSLLDLPGNPGLWRMAFRNNHLLAFPEISMGEDQVFLARNLPHESSIYFSDSIYYTYRSGRPAQLTKNKSKLSELALAYRLILNESQSTQLKNFNFISELLLRQTLTLLKRGDLKLKSRSILYVQEISRGFGIAPTLRSLKRIIMPRAIKQANQRFYVSLTGGLGNQLFQLAAALSMSRQKRVGMVSSFGSPRLNPTGQPDIYDYDCSELGFEVNGKSPSWLGRKVLGYVLRMGVSPRKLEKSTFISHPIEALASIFVSLYLHHPVTVLIGKGVGFFVSEPRQKASMLVGYFQSYRWVDYEPTLSKLRNLTLKEPTQNFRNYAEFAKEKRILAVHIRLGDYKSESNFGLLSPSYYEAAVEEINSGHHFDEIWAFSDEPELAQRNYLTHCNAQVKWIANNEFSSSETLQLMRLCNGFVISNSTFGWWGAKLAHGINPPVIVPSKWFKGMADPVDLIPEDWTKLAPTYVDPRNLH